MVTAIRVIVIFAGVWSLFVTGFLWVLGAVLSMTDRFNGPHTRIMVTIGFFEVVLLFALVCAYRLQTWSLFLFIGDFVAASAVLVGQSFKLSEWVQTLVFLLLFLLPVTLVMVLLTVRWFTQRHIKPD